MLAKSVIPFKDSKWFFFSPVNLKYSNSKRFKRTTKSGFWKPTGKPRDVRKGDTKIGTKKTLVFQNGHVSKGVTVNSNWVIHEYHALNFLQSQVCISFFKKLVTLIGNNLCPKLQCVGV
ncbi:hypothetical protein V8G54_010176 [Vigna mungo]|uniref:NAC domain-containing protein n=1 Tax=Vigna mungo TaxID=3915 RepID=A0AAQ3S681_VIGMU